MNRRAFLGGALAGVALLALAPSPLLAQPSGTIKILTPQAGGGYVITEASPLSGQRGLVMARGREIISAQNQLSVRQQNGLMHRFTRSLLKPQSPASFVRNLVLGGLLIGVTWAVSNHVAITPREGGGFNRSSPASSHPTSSYQLAQSSILNQGSGIFRSSNGQLVAWRVEQGVGAGSRSYAGWSRAHVVNVRTNEIGQTIQKVWFTRVIRAANVASHAEVDLGSTEGTEAEEAYAELAEQTMSQEVAERIEEALINAPAEAVAENEYVAEAPAAPAITRPASVGPAATGSLGGLVNPEPGESEAWAPVVNGPAQAIVNPNVGTGTGTGGGSSGGGTTSPPAGGFPAGEPVEPGAVEELPSFDAFVNPFRNLFDPFAGAFQVGSPSCPSINVASIQFGTYGGVGGQSFAYHCQIIEPFRPIIVAASTALGGYAAVSHILEA